MSTVGFRADPPTQDSRNMVHIVASRNLGHSNMVHVAGSTVHSGRAGGRPNRVNRTNRTGDHGTAPAWRRLGDTASDSAPPGWTRPHHWRVSGTRRAPPARRSPALTAAAAVR